ncbi:MAG: glycosyltransferase [Flavicella sp.]
MSLLLSLFVVVVAVQCSYYIVFSLSFPSKKISLTPTSQTTDKIPISVIICAKNEASNLDLLLPSLLDQQYTAPLEFVLVDDNSTDSTAAVLKKYTVLDKRIKTISIVKNNKQIQSKKQALAEGINQANFNHILCTDADCKPLGKYWIRNISQQFSETKKIVLGYGAYEKVGNSFLNKLIRYETLLTAMQYFSYAICGHPYMGVGRNLAYTKELFKKNGGFLSHEKIASGDDDLFINQVATKINTVVCLEKQSFTVSKVKTTYKDWIRQKRRHISTSSYYKNSHKLLLGLFYLSQIAFPILTCSLLILEANISILLFMILTRYTAYMNAVSRWSNQLNEKDLLLTAPLTEITLIFMQLFLLIKNLIARPQRW